MFTCLKQIAYSILLQDAAPTSSYYLQCCIINVASKQFVGRMAPTAPIPLVASLQAGVVQCNIREVCVSVSHVCVVNLWPFVAYFTVCIFLL